MPTGIVKWFDERQGYGYLVPDEGGPEVFVHRSALASGQTSLAEGQRVEYEVKSSPKGPLAVAARPVNP